MVIRFLDTRGDKEKFQKYLNGELNQEEYPCLDLAQYIGDTDVPEEILQKHGGTGTRELNYCIFCPIIIYRCENKEMNEKN